MQDVGGAIHAYQQALIYDADVADALVALDRLYRRTEQWEPLIDVLSRRAELSTDDAGDRPVPARDRLDLGPAPVRRRPGDHRVPEGARPRSVEPRRAARPRGALREDRADREVPRGPRGTARRTPSDARARLAVRAHGRGVGGAVRQARPRRRGPREDRRDRHRNYSAYHELARLYQQAGKYEALVETYRNHITATTDVATRVELYVAMGQIYETAAATKSTARSRRTTTCCRSTATSTRALDALGRLYEKIGEWDRAIDMMAHLVQLTDDTRKQVELYWRMGRIQYAPARRCRRRRGEPARAASRSIPATCRRWRR